MELKELLETYCAKKKDEIKDNLHSNYAFSYTSYIFRKEQEIQGIEDFVKHIFKHISSELKPQDVRAFYDAIDVLNDLSNFLEEMHEQQDKMSSYMWHKLIFNEMTQIISAPSDKQKDSLDFFSESKTFENWSLKGVDDCA